MAASDGPAVYLCGSYRDAVPPTPSSRACREALEAVRSALRRRGWNAFLQRDDAAKSLTGATAPLAMTRSLAQAAVLTAFVAMRGCSEDGWVAELVDLQHTAPQDRERRALFVQEGYALTRVLAPEDGGLLAECPVAVVPWSSHDDLVQAIENLAVHACEHGHVPAPVDGPVPAVHFIPRDGGAGNRKP